VKESAHTKARRLLVEGRLRVLSASENDGYVSAEVSRRLRPRLQGQLRERALALRLPDVRRLLAHQSDATPLRLPAEGSAAMNLPRIGAEGATATTLRDRALAGLNGESRALSVLDQKRRERVTDALRDARKRRP
jgi:hypothetical protein